MSADRLDVGEDPRADFRADLGRYPRHAFLREQSIWAVAVYRFGRWTESRGLGRRVASRLYWLLHRLVETATGIGIPKDVSIGPGLRIHHFGGIFIAEGVRIGSNCTLRQGVTVGNKTDAGPVPTLGDGVDLGAYAQVLGDVTLGDGSRVGALSVVLVDVPAGATAVGAPARVIAGSGANPQIPQ
jgi:serine O-acetyltransferase